MEKKFKDLPHIQLGNVVYHITSSAAPGFSLCDDARKIVLDSIVFLDGNKFHLYAACVMPNHFHILIRPLKDENGEYYMLDSIMHSIKSYTAHEINKLLNRKGQVWLKDYVDRIVRNDRDKQNVINYILANPVEKGLVKKWVDYPFTWIRGGKPEK